MSLSLSLYQIPVVIALGKIHDAKVELALRAVEGCLPGLDGIEATRRIAAAGGRTRVLIVTVFDFDEYAYEALAAGASGFLLKSALPGEFVGAIHAVAAGEAAVSPQLTRRMLDAHAFDFLAPAEGPRADARLAALSEREFEVLAAIGRGWTNLEIAERFALTESTVKKHVGSVLAKTGARDRVQAVIIAYDAGVVTPSKQRAGAGAWTMPAPREPRVRS